MQIISDEGHQASARAVRVVRLVSTADGRTERLRKLLTASNSRRYIARTYLIKSSLMSAGFSKRKAPPRTVDAEKGEAKKLVAAASDRRNTVVC